MLGPTEFRALVSGQQRGLRAAAWRALLRTAETPYALAMRVRNLRYNLTRYVHVADVPVISVGNLTLGGTGKTPLVAWIARWLRQRDVRVTIVSRGYGAERGEPNDEALELEQRLPDVPHLQNADRVAAAHTAIEEFDCQVVVLDDGFQHRRLARDLDIVLLDACEPFGFGHVFPRGLLREPISGLKRADVVVLSRADMVDPERRAQIRHEVGRYAPHASLGRSASALARSRLAFVDRGRATGRSTVRPAGGGVLRPWQSNRLPPHARRVRQPGASIPRVSGPSSLRSERRRIARRVGRVARRGSRGLHAQGPGEARTRSPGRTPSVGSDRRR